MSDLEVEMAVRHQFLPLFDESKRWFCCVAHRRAGKTCASVQRLIRDALETDKPQSRYAFIAPQFNQAKAIAWDVLKHMTVELPGVTINESELRVDFANGSRIRLFGADSPDRLRGQRFDGVILDEVAQMPVNLWGEVIRPALADRKGWAGMIGTPKGRNVFYDFWQEAQEHDDWTALLLKASDTKLLDDEELAAMRRTMSEDEYAQELECSFEAAVRGAYYGRAMQQAEEDGRISSVPYDEALPVITSWDLGVSDATSIWFWQLAGKEIHAIRHLEFQGMGLPEIVRELQKLPYVYGQHIAPHDIKVRELGSGRSRLDTARDLGIDFTVAPNQGVAEGINAFRNMIGRIWFDRQACNQGIEALKLYRTDFDAKNNVFRTTPMHDWTSHAADSARYFAITPWQVGSNFGAALDYSRMRTHA